jgi:hypothetical protein
LLVALGCPYDRAERVKTGRTVISAAGAPPGHGLIFELQACSGATA